MALRVRLSHSKTVSGTRLVVVLLVHAREDAAERLDAFGGQGPVSDREIEGALGLGRRVQAPSRTVTGDVLEVGERLDQVVDFDVREPERPDAGGVDDPAAERQLEAD